MNKIVLVGPRLFMKFPDLKYFRERVKEVGGTVMSTSGFTDDQVLEEVREAAAIVGIGYPITREMIEGAGPLKFVMTLSVGYDPVDVAAATERGVPVSNCPVYCSAEVAEHALTLTVALLRKVHELPVHVKGGGWDYKQARPIHSFREVQHGIIGLGRIGRQGARKAQGLGMKVAAFDPYVDDDIFETLGVKRYYDLAPFLAECDVVSVHAPLTDETYHLIDGEALSHMKNTAVLVNTARGAIVDREAVEAALTAGKIAGAGLDVLEVEPPTGNEPILTLPNAIVTPHIAWYSEESHEMNKKLGMDELVRVLQGKRPRYVVNPEVFSRR